MNAGTVFVTTFLASAVEAVEMVTIVLGVGATRGWRSTLIGAGVGFLVLAVVVSGLGPALTIIPIAVLRVLVGALLLIFGLQWLRKGIQRVSTRGFLSGLGKSMDDEWEGQAPGRGTDWTAFVLAFKGVLLEGLEVAFIVVTFGAAANHYGAAAIGGGAAIVIIGAAGAAVHPFVARVPRSALMLVVGTALTSFGTFWAVEGLGGEWPAGDAAILGLVLLYAAVAAGFIAVLRRQPVPARATPRRAVT
jgi:uncharacterized membrane protein